jgi:hypothetical protein
MTPLANAPWQTVAGVNPFIIHDDQATIPDTGVDAGSYLVTPYAWRIVAEATVAEFVVSIFIGEPEAFGFVGYVLQIRSDRLTLNDQIHGGQTLGSWMGTVQAGDTVALAWTGDRALAFHNGIVVIDYFGGYPPSGNAGIYYAE